MGTDVGATQPSLLDELHDVAKQIRHGIPTLHLSLSNVTAPTTPSTPSPRPNGGKTMEALKAAIEKDKEEEKQKAVKAGAKAKTTKQKVVSSSSSSGCTSPTSKEGEQTPEKTKSTFKGKEPTRKAPAKDASKPPSAVKAKGKRTLEQPADVEMPPAQKSPCVAREKPQASRSQTSTRTANVSATVSMPTPSAARVEEVSKSSEMEASRSTPTRLQSLSWTKYQRKYTRMCQQ